jgi:hypothetical protein
MAEKAIAAAFDKASSGMLQRKTVAFGGGIAWAMTAYLHPEKVTTTAVTLTKGDVENFVRLATTDYQALTHPNLTNLTDPILRRKAEADISNAQNQFNEKQIIAGALLLDAIFNAYAKTTVPKQLVFIRDSDISWVTAKFLEALNQNYERAIARGAQ